MTFSHHLAVPCPGPENHGIVFHVHNEFGWLLDEELYRQEIAARRAAMGLAAEREVRIRVSHEDFIKDYSMD